MNKQLFNELYTFVDDVNALLRKLSPENFESADIAGVVAGIDQLYNMVEREGLGNHES